MIRPNRGGSSAHRVSVRSHSVTTSLRRARQLYSARRRPNEYGKGEHEDRNQGRAGLRLHESRTRRRQHHRGFHRPADRRPCHLLAADARPEGQRGIPPVGLGHRDPVVASAGAGRHRPSDIKSRNAEEGPRRSGFCERSNLSALNGELAWYRAFTWLRSPRFGAPARLWPLPSCSPALPYRRQRLGDPRRDHERRRAGPNESA